MQLSSEKRLIVAADFKPEKSEGAAAWARDQVRQLARELAGTDVIIKLNSILRALGYGFIEELQLSGHPIFADLKIKDIPETLDSDGIFLQEVSPAILTVDCSSGVKGMADLKTWLPNTKVLGVTVLTSFDGAGSRRVYNREIEDAVLHLASLALEAKLDGLICSPLELSILLRTYGEVLEKRPNFELVTPGIRPIWSAAKDDQQRVMTPTQAISAGASRIVVGRPIIKAENRRAAVLKIIDEIAAVAA